MGKPILFYEVRVHQNRITGAPVYVPAIVDREEAVPLATIIERAIDRGLFAGLKLTAAHGIFEFSMLDAEGRPITVTKTARWQAS